MNEAASPQLMRGLQLRQLGRFADAAGAFREALSADPYNDFAFHQLALCQLQMPEQKREALGTIDQAIQLEPEDADHHVLKSFILVALDRPREALKSARQALAIDPYLPPAFAGEAQAHLALSDWPQAEASARQALALDPDFTVAANQLAHALRLQNKLDENAAQIAAMLARNPDDADTHTSAGWSALQRGEHRQAETHFREALRLEPGHESARDGMLTSFRARSPFFRGYLRYVFFMQRIGANARWAVIIGLYLGAKFIPLIVPGPLGIAIVALYLMFVLWVWVATAFGNFILLFDRFARVVLRRDEKIEAVAVGGALSLGLVLVGIALALKAPPFLIPGLALIASSFPLSMTFTNDAKAGAIASALVSAATLSGGFFSGLDILWPSPMGPVASALFGCGLAGCLISTWLGNFRFFRKPR
ncbi:MAG: tetratricopeptide repeat protein [Chthoniobacteraceae bacterium]